jgi:ABC-type amino acid transport substrate-binding protein
MRGAALAVAVVLAVTATGGAEVRRVRLCADPSNLPFSARQDTAPGFEVEVARALAQTLGAELDVHWVPTVREVVALRQLDEGRCDVFMGLPLTPAFRDEKPKLVFTGPYYVLRQAVVSPAVGGVRSLDDLAGKLVGVQAMTLGDHLAYRRGDNRKVYRAPAELFTALARAEVDAAVIDAPLAGWFTTRTPGFRVVEITDPARDIPIGAAVRKADVALKDQLDGAIRSAQGATAAILARYGIVQAPTQPASPALTAELRAARSTYLTQCSQCHGVDAKGTPAAANLLTFKGSEDDFVRIVLTGRPGTAMTPWKGLISDDDIRTIARYVKQLSPDAPR